jgi:nucleotide-binding universal stress UspA family protein
VRQGFDRTDEHLIALAEHAEVDLLVVGSHQRSRIDRLWRGSVSRGVLLFAPLSVASVPRSSPVVREAQPIPTLSQVLAATDFSDAGDRAVLHAVSLVPSGGTVHVVHVLTPEIRRRPFTVTEMVATRGHSQEWRRMVQEVHDRLERLVPVQAASRGVHVVVDVLEGDVAEEIRHAAERLAVDLICVGSRGRSGLTAALLGSVARGVIAKSRRPVLIVPPREP